MAEKLIEQVASLEVLTSALNSLRKSSTGAGVDGETVIRFREDKHERLAGLSKSLANGTFKFDKLRAVAIAKSGGGHRPLSIPTVKDRIVQRALLTVIGPRIKQHVRSPGSHAYLARRGLKSAIAEVKRFLKQGNYAFVQTDIKKFFDHLKAADAIDKLSALLTDNSLSALLSQYVGWEVDGVDALSPEVKASFPAGGKTTGLPQGTALAPTLANLMLGDIDRDARVKGFNMVRYADDIIIFAPTSGEALVAFDWLEAELRKVNLQVYDPRSNSPKARLVADVRAESLEYLGFYIRMLNGKVYIQPQANKVDSITHKLCEIIEGKTLRKGFPERIVAASQAANSWVTSYSKICGVHRVARKINTLTSLSIEQVLKARGIIDQSASLDENQRAFLGFRMRRRHKATRRAKSVISRMLP